MYTTMWCGYCGRARRLLQSKGVAFEEIDVDAHPNGRAEMMARGGGRTVPQIFIGDLAVGGSDELRVLEISGRLDALLKGNETP